jgi:hypothetical protein
MSNHPHKPSPCPVCGFSTRRESCKPLAHRDQYHPDNPTPLRSWIAGCSCGCNDFDPDYSDPKESA